MKKIENAINKGFFSSNVDYHMNIEENNSPLMI